MDFVKDFVAASIPCAIYKAFSNPFQQAKIIITFQHTNPRIASGEIPPYRGILDIYQRIPGFRLMRGYYGALSRNVPIYGFNFSFKEFIKPRISTLLTTQASSLNNLLINTFSGGIAGVATLVITFPRDYHRIFRVHDAILNSKKSFNGFNDRLLNLIYGPGGLISRYNFFGVYALHESIYRGVYFGLNDTLADINPYQHRSDLIGLGSKLCQAYFATFSGIFIAYPINMVSRHLEIQSDKTPSYKPSYRGGLNWLRHAILTNGVIHLKHARQLSFSTSFGPACVLFGYGEIRALMK